MSASTKVEVRFHVMSAKWISQRIKLKLLERVRCLLVVFMFSVPRFT